ncbi:lipase maturation factor 1-like isoform X2 [Corticium candelabrum]|uniref:lipase maturation factor 1-like isoform X2 n=1 Tax=Corticium candelabrum TaxID=121492 RepID=UPI002E331FA2|nr:lipase maturation factor 1-like isoform X2 [Corticium candelabrum]XP_062508001.1 lipase maturation factor 1-like isoform X2 [Corticium candelabrum]
MCLHVARELFSMSESEVRHRKGGSADRFDEQPRNEQKQSDKTTSSMRTGTFWLTRIVFLRSLAFVYFVAFLVAYHQNKELLGSNGLLPIKNYLNHVRTHFKGINIESVTAMPTLLWWCDYENRADWLLDVLALFGLTVSGGVLLMGSANMFIMALLWVLYHSVVNVGQRWYSFGWESQLLETGFLAIFACPVFSLRQIPVNTPLSAVVVWGYRWLIFRIMIGAGLIKIRGDQCWRDLTCMNYHYETQPVPSPISYYLHQNPEFIHKFETLSNHFVELVVPFFMLIPLKNRFFSSLCGFLQILFQIVLIISGNLSFLNWLTILPCILFFDDCHLSFLFSKKSSTSAYNKVRQLQLQPNRRLSASQYIRSAVNCCVGLLIAYLSIPVVQNLLSSQQMMNTSFDSLRIVNTYGAFGSITKERTEVIFQGTRNTTLLPDSAGAQWEEFEFKCKPGNVSRRPCLISPYHYRLDWLMWFAAFQNYQHNPWLVHLAAKFLVGDETVDSLIDYNPFAGGDPPSVTQLARAFLQFVDLHDLQVAYFYRVI